MFKVTKTALGLGLLLGGTATLFAQMPNPVQWTAIATPGSAGVPGTKLVLTASAEVQEGWHVYAITQAAGGPTPLHIALVENAAVQAAGSVIASTPVTQHDASFNLETQTYLHGFTLRLPVQVKRNASFGQQQVPVDVRYQACSERTCLPPRTVHLLVPVDVAQR